MGKSFLKYKSAAGGAKVTPIVDAPLDKWFVDEELARPTNSGHVFFVHAKVLLIDPLSDDPLVCSGSANFSKNSLIANDENMLLIRGNTRIADIYMTEIDRIFRHFYARDVINKLASAGSKVNPLLLDPTDAWIGQNFKAGTYKDNRRRLFFPASPPKPWAALAANDPDPFADEQQRADQARADRNAKAKDRRQPAAAGGGKKTKAGGTKKKKAASKKAVKKTKKTAVKKKTAKKKKTTARKSKKTKRKTRL
jgi:phosphatidylserine/phosphatidylglycerophosphate/cardiolipin synthase-like enzyme